MELTNRLNLPSTIVSAIEQDPYCQDGDISATGLIQPPRIRQLTERHHKKLSIDVADRIWPLLGSNTHYILERADTKDGLQEERFSISVDNWIVTGQPDLYENNTIFDYKITSVWSVLHGAKDDWIRQLNIYAELMRQANFRVKALKIITILRDWSKYQVKKSSDYPKTQVKVIPIDLWPAEKAQEYIEERVKFHQICEKLPDEDLPLCTAEERWERPTKYAVKTKGVKKARRVLDTMEDAQTWAENNMKKDFEIEIRQGESIRCASYCDCAPYCNFYQKLMFNNYFKEG